ncbi:MAG TPA: DUF3352 domain-containing protein, partial [Candidatus Obscuribacterales bacterium]
MVFAKKPPLIVTLGTALLLIGGGVLAYGALRWRLTQARGIPAGVNAVPQAAIAAVTLSTDTEQWEQLRQFGTPDTQAAFDRQLAEWRDRWLADYGLTFANDIAPWVGPEITVAWVPEAAAATEEGTAIALGSQRRLVLLPIDDPEAAQISAAALP